MAPIIGIMASQISGHLWPANSYESISTVNVSSGTSSISLTSIPSTYTHLQLRGIALTSTNQNIGLRFNSDTGGNYNTHSLVGNGSSVVAGATGTSDTNIYPISAYWGTGATYPAAFVIDILDYANTNKYKVIRSLAGRNTNGGNEEVSLLSGLWRNTGAITSITLVGTGGTNIDTNSSFELYGIK